MWPRAKHVLRHFSYGGSLTRHIATHIPLTHTPVQTLTHAPPQGMRHLAVACQRPPLKVHTAIIHMHACPRACARVRVLNACARAESCARSA